MVSTEEPDSAWIVSTDAGDRVLVATGEIVLSTSTLGFLGLPLTDDSQSIVGKRVLSTVTIAILDYAPHANERTFGISQRLAAAPSLNRQDDRFIAFSLDGWVWTDSGNAGPKDNGIPCRSTNVEGSSTGELSHP